MSTDIRDFSYGVIDKDDEIIAAFQREADAQEFKKLKEESAEEDEEFEVVELYQNYDTSANFSF